MSVTRNKTGAAIRKASPVALKAPVVADETRATLLASTAIASEAVVEIIPETPAVAEQSTAVVVAEINNGLDEVATGARTAENRNNEGLGKVMKSAEEFVAFGQGNVEALLKSSQIMMTGLQDLSRQFVQTVQSSYEDSLANARAFAGVKSFKDVVDLNLNYARSTLEKTVSESGRYTDASLKLAEQAIAPISGRVSLAVEKFAKVA